MRNAEWGEGNLNREPSPLSEFRRVEMDADFREWGIWNGEGLAAAFCR